MKARLMLKALEEAIGVAQINGWMGNDFNGSKTFYELDKANSRDTGVAYFSFTSYLVWS